MSKKDRGTLKGYFNTGDIPTEAQFADLVDTIFDDTSRIQLPINITTVKPLRIDGGGDASLNVNRTLTILPATQTYEGSMSALDKTKLDLLTLEQALTILGGGNFDLSGYDLTVLNSGTVVVTQNPPGNNQILKSENGVPEWGTIDTNDILNGSNRNFITDEQLNVLTNTSGSNTGDQIIPDDTSIQITDNESNNANIFRHGWFPKLPQAQGKFLKDDLTWEVPQVQTVYLEVLLSDGPSLEPITDDEITDWMFGEITQ